MRGELSPSGAPPSPAHVGRFRADLLALVPAGPAPATPLGVAVSGGPDSLALLLLADAAFPAAVTAATVDHGLRAEAAAEAAFVARVCGGLGVPHHILSPASPIGGSVQAAARSARYDLLERWRHDAGAAFVATAHHADDQAETLLMRLNRGAGVGGLAGIRPVNGRIVRPLLGWRRHELAAIVAAAGIDPVDDPSNADPRFDRVRLRGALAAADWIDPAALTVSASHLADAEEAILWMVARLAGDRIVRSDAGLTLDPAGLPAELRRRLLAHAIARLDPACRPSGPEMDRLLAALEAGSAASIGRLTARPGALWRLEPAPPRRNP